MNDQIQEAIRVAKRDLRLCYTDSGILTGSRGVYWSWDSFFASFGVLEIGDDKVVRKNLELYLENQNKEGNIPKRIANPFYPLRFLGFPIKETPDKQRPSYASPYYTGQSLAQGPAFIISFCQYIKKTSDWDFLRGHFVQLEKLMDFLGAHTYSNGLLRECIGGGWAESILKRGAIAFTNVCYAKSLDCMQNLAESLKKTRQAEEYRRKYQTVKKAINHKLWEAEAGGFYSDWIGYHRHHHFTADGNLLAILWDIADEPKIKCINGHLNELIRSSKVPIPLTLERYYFWRIFFTNQLAGLKNYHMRFSWLWLGSLAALAKLKIGQKKEAKEILSSIARVIVRDGTVHEIYKKGKPVRQLFYKSENPWAWAAGFFLYACKQAGLSV